MCAVNNSLSMNEKMSEQEKMNAALLKLEQFLFSGHSTLVQPEVYNDMLHHCATPEEAMGYLICAAFGISMTTCSNQQFLQHWLLPSLRSLRTESYEADAYRRILGNASAVRGNVVLQTDTLAPCQLFPCGDLQLSDGGTLLAPVGFFCQPYSYPALYQDGKEWMTLMPNEIETMRAPFLNLHGHVLVFGLGIGYYAYLAASQADVKQVTVVDSSEDVTALFNDILLPLWPKEVLCPQIVVDDAFHYAEQNGFCCSDGEKADIVFTDLWHDASDGMALYQRMRALARRSAAHTDFRYWIEPTMKYYLGEQ